MVVFVVLWTLDAGFGSSSRQVKASQRVVTYEKTQSEDSLTHILGDVLSAVVNMHRVWLCALGYSEMLG